MYATTTPILTKFFILFDIGSEENKFSHVFFNVVFVIQLLLL